jgi:hypothetical protein
MLGQTRLQFGERDVVSLIDKREDQIGLRLDPPRVTVAAPGFRPRTAHLPIQSAPADRARRAHAEPFRRLPPGHPAGDSPDHTLTKIQR